MDLRSKNKNLLAFQCTFNDLLASERITAEFLIKEYEEVYNSLKYTLKRNLIINTDKYMDMLKNIRAAMDYYSIYYPSIHDCSIFSPYSEYPDMDEWGEGMSEFLGECLMEQEWSEMYLD